MDWHKALGWLRSQTRQELAPEQLEAVKLALSSKAAVLTGGPGCGKSFTVRSIVELATVGPGFAVDEPVETLGHSLALPPWLERNRREIEAQLKPIAAPAWPIPAGVV